MYDQLLEWLQDGPDFVIGALEDQDHYTHDHELFNGYYQLIGTTGVWRIAMISRMI